MPPELIPVDYDPFGAAAEAFPAFRPGAPNPDDLPQPLVNDFPVSQGVKAFNKLFGAGGEPRQVLWPEAMVRQGVNLVGRASKGDNPFETITGMPGASAPGSQDATYEPNMLGRALGMTEPWQAPSSTSGIAGAQALSGLMAGGPLTARPGVATLGSGAMRPGEAILPRPEAPPFYSAVEAAVRDAPQAAMSPEQWRGYLTNRPGVKKEELDWTGLPEGQKVSKQEMLDHVQEHGVQVKEVEKSNAGMDESKIDRVIEANLEDHVSEFERDMGRAPRAHELNDMRTSIREQLMGDPEAFEFTSNELGGPKFSEYQLPGGENYREKLFTLPEKPAPQGSVVDAARKMAKQEGDQWETLTQEERRPYLEAAHQDAKGDNYHSSHWDEPNVLAHVRMNDRYIPDGESKSLLPEGWQLKPSSAMDRGIGDGQKTWGVYDPKGQFHDYTVGPDEGVATSKWAADNGVDLGKSAGLKTLHLEELQSDWHQAGRKEGYNKPPDTSKWIVGQVEPAANGKDPLWFVRDEHGTNLANFRKPTSEEALNAAVATQSKLRSPIPDAPFKTTWPDLVLKRMIREAAENGYDAISWTPGEAQAARYDLSKHYDNIAATKRADGTYNLGGTQAGHRSQNALGDRIPEAKLADYVGKDLAEKIIKDGGGEYSGVDLKVGGEGMKGFYDKILVDKANALAKKFGGKVEYKDLNPTRFKIETNKYGGANVVADDGTIVNSFNNKADAEKWVSEDTEFKTKIPVLRLTPQMKDTALRKGFPLFSGGVMLQPVDHDPFKEQ